MTERKHILITGAVGAGKSTLIRRLLNDWGRPVCGFVTKRLAAGADGFHPIYIHPAGQPEAERVYTGENLAGVCDSKRHRVNLTAFDRLGVEYLKAAPGSVIVMDELGFLESGAEQFTEAVFSALEGEIPVIAAVKAREGIAFLDRVRACPRATLFTLTPDTRERLYPVIRDACRLWEDENLNP